jgi:hypothetical protein
LPNGAPAFSFEARHGQAGLRHGSLDQSVPESQDFFGDAFQQSRSRFQRRRPEVVISRARKLTGPIDLFSIAIAKFGIERLVGHRVMSPDCRACPNFRARP